MAEPELGSALLRTPLFPQGLEIAAAMQATDGDSSRPLFDTVVVELPRRSTKTTAITATLLGRCFSRPRYRVASTAQDGLHARHKLREVMDELDVTRSMMEQQGLDVSHFPKPYRGVPERLEWPNGSYWKALPPDPGAFRSDAFDAVLCDEAGELDPEKAAALQAGYLPTLDTRPNSQVIVAGTPGETRAGLLWDSLGDLAAGEPGVGGVVYAAADTDTFADYSDPDNPVFDLELLRRIHPGIQCGLTTLEKVFSRLKKMGLQKFEAEYLCKWPVNAGASALNVTAWAACAAPDGLPPRPDKVGLGWDVDPDGMKGALVAAWRDDRGRAHFEVLACRPGSDWLPQVTKTAVAKFNRPACYDSIGQNLEVAERMQRSRVRSRPLRMRDLVGAAARFEKAISNSNVVHYDQQDLTDAVNGACWRPAGVDGRLFARKASAASVCTVVAASEALWDFDSTQRQSARTGIRSSVGMTPLV